MDREALREKFRGALLGVAVGDALGAPFEGVGYIPEDSLLAQLEGEVGQLRYTDDTHMTIGVAESLLEIKGFDGPHMAETLARNYEQEPWRGYGPGPPQVFRLLRQGIPWDQGGRRLFGGVGSYGNGAAMRVTPVALAYYQDLIKLAEVARQSAVITHAHELGIQGALLQAFAIARLVEQPPNSRLSGPAFSELLMTHATDATASLYVHKLKELKELLPNTHPLELASRLGNGIEAYQAVPAALYSFLSRPASFSEAIRYAIRLGGDTDTIASMTGALSGAHLGESAIPLNWRKRLEGIARISELADGLLEVALSRKK